MGGKALRVFFDWWSGVSHGSPTWQEDLCFSDWFEGPGKVFSFGAAFLRRRFLVLGKM